MKRLWLFIFTFLSACLIFRNVDVALAQNSHSVLYVPLIGITSVPQPSALPQGSGTVTYSYAIKNFLREVPLTNIKVIDSVCSPIKYVTGDDNRNDKLDFDETWRYSCTVKISQTTENTVTVTGTSDNLTATQKAISTVVVGSNTSHPLISIINITKIAYPLSLQRGGGEITFTYKVNNPGDTPLSNVLVSDDKCKTMSGKLGDTNGNNLLDINENWVYTCTMNIKQTTTSTAKATGYANGIQAVSSAPITVVVAPSDISSLGLPETGTNPNLKTTVWKYLFGILVVLILIFLFIRNKKPKKMQ